MRPLFQKQQQPPSPCLQIIRVGCKSHGQFLNTHTVRQTERERERHTYAHWHNTEATVSATTLHLMQQRGNTPGSCLHMYNLMKIKRERNVVKESKTPCSFTIITFEVFMWLGAELVAKSPSNSIFRFQKGWKRSQNCSQVAHQPIRNGSFSTLL